MFLRDSHGKYPSRCSIAHAPSVQPSAMINPHTNQTRIELALITSNIGRLLVGAPTCPKRIRCNDPCQISLLKTRAQLSEVDCIVEPWLNLARLTSSMPMGTGSRRSV